MEGRLGPAKGKSFDGGNVHGPVDRHRRRDRRSPDTEDRSARQRQDALHGRHERHAVLVRGDSSPTPRRTRRSDAGELFGSGTVGNGCGLEIGWFLESGDEIELDVDRIGVLRNTVVAQNVNASANSCEKRGNDGPQV